MVEVTIPAINPEEQIDFMNIDETDFGSFSREAQIRHLEVEGYVVLSEILDREQIAKLKAELTDMPMQPKPYSEYQTTGKNQPQWHSQAVAELIGHQPTIDFLTDLMGPDIVFTRGFFQRTNPGSPTISLHTDGQPFGSSIFGYEGSSPRLLRVLYYLDDLIPTRAPFRLVPRSHLSYHAQGSPYLRYKSHPEERTICCKAGSAVIMPVEVFHGTHPNTDNKPRELIQFGYRPAWAAPIQPMEEWDPELVAAAPEQARPYLQSLNTGMGVWEQEHKPAGMKAEAPGIDPSRWGGT